VVDVEDVVVGGIVDVLASGAVVDVVVGGVVDVLEGNASVDVVPTPTLLAPQAATVTSRRGPAALPTRPTFLMVPLKPHEHKVSSLDSPTL
jgi:hypothetical protein